MKCKHCGEEATLVATKILPVFYFKGKGKDLIACKKCILSFETRRELRERGCFGGRRKLTEDDYYNLSIDFMMTA